MNICMFSNLFPPVVSGSSIQLAALSAELARSGSEVVVITAKASTDSADYEIVNGVHVYRLPARRLPKMSISLNFPWLTYTFTRGNLRRIEAIIQRHNPDIFHLHNHMFDLAPAAVLMRRRFRKPLVITLHTFIKHANNLYNVFLYPADRILLNYLIIRQANTLICPDLNTVNYAREAFGKTNVVLVPYGINIPETPAEGYVEQLRTKYGLNNHRVILSLGHLHKIRNRKDLVEALPLVLKEYPNTVLLIVGMVGDDTPAVLARQLGIQESVIFTGHVPYVEVPALLALSDLEAHWLNQDSPDKTSLGVASLEAMGAGKVVVAAASEDNYGVGVLKNGENVILVKPGDPEGLAQRIIELFRDEQERTAIGKRARQTVKDNFSWDGVRAQTVKVYERAIAQTTGQSSYSTASSTP